MQKVFRTIFVNLSAVIVFIINISVAGTSFIVDELNDTTLPPERAYPDTLG